MKHEPIPVTRAVITWARERAGFTVEQAAEKFRAIGAWDAGDGFPSYPQLEGMADLFKVPIAVFFFPEPPNLPPISDSFRTLPDNEFKQLPPRIRDLVRKAKAFQLSLQELAGQNPAKRQIVNDLSFSLRMTPPAMAKRVRDYLGVSFDEQVSWTDTDAALANWRDALLSVGIYTFKDSFLVKGYSGFCLFDPVFPIIYVNNTSAKTRQTSTLFGGEVRASTQCTRRRAAACSLASASRSRTSRRSAKSSRRRASSSIGRMAPWLRDSVSHS